MNNQQDEHSRSLRVLSTEALSSLQKKGFQYVQVRGLGTDNRQEYIEPHCLVLVPMKSLPVDPAQKGIYEKTDSKLLQEWAAHPGDGIKVVIAPAR